jgi:hypothetical protein
LGVSFGGRDGFHHFSKFVIAFFFYPFNHFLEVNTSVQHQNMVLFETFELEFTCIYVGATAGLNARKSYATILCTGV